MSNTQKTTDWAEREPYKSFVATAEILESQGISAEEITDSLLSMALTWAQEMRGARHISRQLYLLAQKFAVEADHLEGVTTAGGANGLVH